MTVCAFWLFLSFSLATSFVFWEKAVVAVVVTDGIVHVVTAAIGEGCRCDMRSGKNSGMNPPESTIELFI